MLSELQKKKLTRYFQVYDLDDDGRIEQSDFERVLENVRMLRGDQDGAGAFRLLREGYLGRWAGLRSAADGDGDGSIDLDEWLDYWRAALADDARYQAEVEAITDRLFTVFDLDEDGLIGPDEFADFFGVFGLAVDLSRSVFRELDGNGDGAISREELLRIAGEFYRGSDPEARGNFLFGPFGG